MCMNVKLLSILSCVVMLSAVSATAYGQAPPKCYNSVTAVPWSTQSAIAGAAPPNGTSYILLGGNWTVDSTRYTGVDVTVTLSSGDGTKWQVYSGYPISSALTAVDKTCGGTYGDISPNVPNVAPKPLVAALTGVGLWKMDAVLNATSKSDGKNYGIANASSTFTP